MVYERTRSAKVSKDGRAEGFTTLTVNFQLAAFDAPTRILCEKRSLAPNSPCVRQDWGLQFLPQVTYTLASGSVANKAFCHAILEEACPQLLARADKLVEPVSSAYIEGISSVCLSGSSL